MTPEQLPKLERAVEHHTARRNDIGQAYAFAWGFLQSVTEHPEVTIEEIRAIQRGAQRAIDKF